MTKSFCLLVVLFFANFISAAQSPTITRIATGLENPRGIAVLPDGRLLVAQAGTGYSSSQSLGYTGRLSLLSDWNKDGDYDDAAEVIDVQENLPSYNILYQSNPGRDEVIGIGDVIVLENGRIFYTLDNNFKLLAIVELEPNFDRVGNFYRGDGSMNSIAHDSESDTVYFAESTNNAIGAVSLAGVYREVARFDMLAHDASRRYRPASPLIRPAARLDCGVVLRATVGLLRRRAVLYAGGC